MWSVLVDIGEPWTSFWGPRRQSFELMSFPIFVTKIMKEDFLQYAIRYQMVRTMAGGIWVGFYWQIFLPWFSRF